MKFLSGTFSLYKGLPRSIYVLFASQIVNSIGHFVFPFLTIFLTDRLGMPADKAGLMLFISAAMFIPGSFIGGKLADHIGRKRVMVFAQLLGAAMFVPCAFLGSSPQIPFFIIAANLFHGAAMPCFRAVTADLTGRENRKPAFSLLYLGHNIGFAVGPLIAGFLYNDFMMWIFLGDAVTTVIAVTLVIIFVPETMPDREEREKFEHEESAERAEEGNLLTALLRRPFLLLFLLITFLMSFVYAQFTFGLPLQVNEVFGRDGPKYFGYIMTANALVVIFLTTFIISLTRNLKPILGVAASAFLYALGFGVLFFLVGIPEMQRLSLYIVSTFIWTVGEIIAATNINVYIANHTPVTHRGRFNSVLPLITGAGEALSPPLMGLYIEKRSVRYVWPLVFLLGLAAGISYLFLHRRERSRAQSSSGSPP